MQQHSLLRALTTSARDVTSTQLGQTVDLAYATKNISGAFRVGYQQAQWHLLLRAVGIQSLDFGLTPPPAPVGLATTPANAPPPEKQETPSILSMAVTEATGNKPKDMSSFFKRVDDDDFSLTFTGTKTFVTEARNATHMIVVGKVADQPGAAPTPQGASLRCGIINLKNDFLTEEKFVVKAKPELPYVREVDHGEVVMKDCPVKLIPPPPGSQGSHLDAVEVLRAFRLLEDLHVSVAVGSHLLGRIAPDEGMRDEPLNLELSNAMLKLAHATTAIVELVADKERRVSSTTGGFSDGWLWRRNDHQTVMKLHGWFNDIKLSAPAIATQIVEEEAKRRAKEGSDVQQLVAKDTLLKDLKILDVAQNTRDNRFLRAMKATTVAPWTPRE